MDWAIFIVVLPGKKGERFFKCLLQTYMQEFLSTIVSLERKTYIQAVKSYLKVILK